MDTGVGFFATRDAIGPAALARLVEEHGHAAMYFPEHSHIPAGRETSYPGGGELPRKYAHTYDLFVACAPPRRRRRGRASAAASASSSGATRSTRRRRSRASTTSPADASSSASARAGTARRWPTTAPTRACGWRSCASASRRCRRSGPARRRATAASSSHSSASGRGPKPAQWPHPPVLVGGNGPTVIDLVLSFGDAWFPNWAPGTLERIPELRSRAADAGRDVRVYVMGALADAHVLEGCREAGDARAVHWLPSANRSRVERALEDFEDAFADINGE